MVLGRDFIGKYQLTRLIRAGHTCQVWESRDLDHRRVCLKVLQPEMRSNKEEIRYMQHEYNVGHPLHHPNVIEIYALEMDRDNVPFLVMEFHTGKNVKLLLREGHERIAWLVPTLIRTAAQGLAYFHDQGWVHRDVKPDNFLVNEEGVAKLIDFALAQKQASGMAQWFGRKGKVQGTRSYMAPEQIRGLPPDRRADIYSFGCMMYEVLTGRTPFTGTNPSELLNKHLRQPAPPAAASNRNVTSECNELILKMMAKRPQDRPQSMQEVLRSLDAMRVLRSLPKRPDDAAEAPAATEP